jgi:hypothetical protein
MGYPCVQDGENRETCRILVRKPLETVHFKRARRIWGVITRNFTFHRQGMYCEGEIVSNSGWVLVLTV